MCAIRSICLVGISGNLRRPSRTRELVEHIGGEATRNRSVAFSLYDLVDAGLVDSAVIDRAADAASQLNVAIDTRLANMRGRTNGVDGPGASSCGVVANTATLRQSSHGGAS
jgi:hypothetical protein